VNATARLLLGIALSAAFTGSVIHYSQRHGRLQYPPTYDDVAYMSDAAERVAYLEEHKNVGDLVKHTLASPPHSPLAAALGVPAFLIFGMKDWAPYAANGLLVLALLAMVDFLFRDRPTVVRLAMAALALSLPLTGLLVFEFRPDPATAMMSGFAVALAFERFIVESSWRRPAAVGAAFGLAILFKPSFFVLVSAVVAATMAGVLMARPSRLREAARSCLWLVAAAAVVGSPPLALRPGYYLSYLKAGLFTPPIALHPAPWHERASYYLTGISYYLMRVEHLWLLAGSVALCGAVLAYRRSWDGLKLVALPLIPLAAAFLPPTLTSMREPVFGLMFAGVLSFVAFRALAEIKGRTGTVLAVAVSLLGVWWARPPVAWPSTPAHVQARWRLVDEIYGALRGRIDRPDVRLWVTAAGQLSPELMIYYCLRDRLPVPVIRYAGAGTPQETKDYVEWAELVVAPSPEAADVWPYTARARVRGETLSALRAADSMALFRTVRDSAGAAYYLYERTGPFFGFHDARGLDAIEGPYPQLKLGQVRWGLGPSTALQVDVAEPGRYRLTLEAAPAIPRQEARFLVDGQEITRHTFPTPYESEEVHARLELATAGPHMIEIVYGDWARGGADPRPLALLFKRLQFRPAAEGPAATP